MACRLHAENGKVSNRKTTHIFRIFHTLHKKTKMGILLITHYNRILQYLEVDKVYIMEQGKITRSGDATLAHEIEKTGYKKDV